VPLAATARRPRVRDDFIGAAPRAEWVATDTEGKVSLAGGQLVVAGGKAVPAFDDPRMTYAAKSWLPKVGLTFEAEITWTAFGAAGCDFGLDTTNPVADGLQPGFQVFAGGVLRAIQAQGAVARQATAVTLALNTPYRFRVLLLDPALGVAWSLSSDRGATWTVVFVDSQWPTAGSPLRMGFSNNDAAFTVEYMAAAYARALSPALSDTFAARTSPGRADTGQPWLGASGKALPVLAGDMRIPAGSTESWLIGRDGISDGVWEGDLNFGGAPSTQKQAYSIPRHRDLTNYVRVGFNRAAQTITVVRVANNVAATLATLSSAGFADNTTYRMRVECVGPVIVVYQDGVEKARTAEAFGQYFGLCSWYLNDNLATPDIRWGNVRVWGVPIRPLLMDSFDRPDAETLGLTDTGQAYTLTNDVNGVPTAGIESGRAKLTGFGAGFGNQRLAQAALGRPAYVAAFVLRATDFSAQSTSAGCVLRWVDYQDYVAVRAIFHPTPASCNVSVMKNVAGTQSVVLSTAWTPVANQDYQFVVVMVGNTVEVYRDGSRILNTTVTDHATTPAGGPLFGGSTLNSRVDDIRYLPLGPASAHDSFTRADSALTLGNSELSGTPWQPVVGTWGINSAQAYCADSSAGARLAGLPVIVPDIDVQADVARQTGTVGLVARADAAGNNYLLAQFDGTNLKVSERVSGGSVADLASIAFAWTAGATAKNIRVRIYQSLVTVFADGVQVLAQAFSGHAGAAENLCGLYVNQTVNTNRFDSFLVREVAA
jgi:hypothetical protein